MIVASIEKVGAFLRFIQVGFAEEREHLKERSENDRSAIIERAKELSKEGMTQRVISKELSISLGAVNKYLKL